MFQITFTTGFIAGAWLISPAAAASANGGAKPLSLTAQAEGSLLGHTWELCTATQTRGITRAVPNEAGNFYTYPDNTDLEKLKDGIENQCMLFPDDWHCTRELDGTVIGFCYDGWFVPPLKKAFLHEYFDRRDAAVSRPQRTANRVKDTLRHSLFEMDMGGMHTEWVDQIGHQIVKYITAETAKKRKRGSVSSGNSRTMKKNRHESKTADVKDWGSSLAARLVGLEQAALEKTTKKRHRKRPSKPAQDVPGN